MNRRAVIGVIGGAMAIPSLLWPKGTQAQPAERARRVGVLMLYVENDPEGQIRAQAFRQELEKLGWMVGRNLQIQTHWGVGDRAWLQSAAAELLRSAPDVILANGSSFLPVLRQSSSKVPIVFIGGSDPVADGSVQSMAHPGGNATGFTTLEPSLGPKLLELLKEVAPHVTRVAALINPNSPSAQRLFDAAGKAAQRFTVQLIAARVRDATEVEAAIAQWGSDPNGGLIVFPDPIVNTYRKTIIALAERHRLPAIHALKSATSEGALMSYGVDVPELFRHAAGYVDRILRGARPADLPVQQPTKFELVINLKTAKALGLEIPPTVLAIADEVIE
jgi:putative tryptophan/tyrosine transport system substrate-binding protein